MSLDVRPQTVTAEQYATLFATERVHEYPSVDALEARLGFALDRVKLEAAARVMSCPFKAAAPNWQHGRVIYAVASRRLAQLGASEPCALLDVGTAKGYSALCALWALEDAGRNGTVTSVDVMAPQARVRRNTVAEVDALRTLAEILAPWPETQRIRFLRSTGVEHLNTGGDRIHVAFVDGKHSTEAVGAEWRVLAVRQQRGDVAIFDDVQMPPVRAGLKGAEAKYEFEELALGSVNRAYAIGVRR